MTILATTVEGKKIALVTVSGPASYTGVFPVTFNELYTIEHILSAKANTGLVVVGNVPAASGNIANVTVYWQTGASGTPLAQVAAGTNLSSVTFELIGIGY